MTMELLQCDHLERKLKLAFAHTVSKLGSPVSSKVFIMKLTYATYYMHIKDSKTKNIGLCIQKIIFSNSCVIVLLKIVNVMHRYVRRVLKVNNNSYTSFKLKRKNNIHKCHCNETLTQTAIPFFSFTF